MPEMKRNFTKGKMNKDLDERLVPPGEYRDAMNVQVSSSEESEIGTIQNVLGNTPGCFYEDSNDNPIQPASTTIGSVSDEKNDSLYWLVAGPNSGAPSSSGDYNIKKDMIMRTNPALPSGCEPVFVDIYNYVVDNIDNSTAINQLNSPGIIDFAAIGMTATGYDASGVSQFSQSVINVGTINSIPGVEYNVTMGMATSIPVIPNTNIAPTAAYVQCGNEFAPGNVISPGPYTPGASGSYIPSGFYDINNVFGGVFPNLPNGGTNYLRITDPNGFVIINTTQYSVIPDPSGSFNDVVVLNDPNDLLIFQQEFESGNYDLAGSYAGCGPNIGAGAIDMSGWGFSIDYVIPTFTNEITVTDLTWVSEIDLALSGGAIVVSIDDGSNSWPSNSCLVEQSPVNPGVYDVVSCSDLTTPVLPSSNNPVNLSFSNDLSVNSAVLAEDVDLSNVSTIEFGFPRVLNFQNNNLVTGINIVDDMLFWTDNFTEPKKINISRSIEGTEYNGEKHTAIVNDATGLSLSNYHPVQEEHITVIRKTPKNALTLEMSSGRDPELNYSGITYTAIDPSINANINASSIINSSNNSVISDFSTLQLDDTVQFEIETDSNNAENFTLAWKEGDIIILKEYDVDDYGVQTSPPLPLTNFTIRGVITDWQYNQFENNQLAANYQAGLVGSDWPSSAPGTAHVEIRIIGLDGTPPQVPSSIIASGGTVLNYAVDLEVEQEAIFEDKFPRFSYRYKYGDGEYSTFAPWSDVGFLPSNFSYESSKGYNKGMVNHATSIQLQGFVPTIMNQPLGKDVIEVDILYKEEGSPNVYVVETISPLDLMPTGTPNPWYTGTYTIESESIKYTLPSNQLLRSWDNVPKKALAQDVTGSRIIYGNYEQNFDLLVGDSGGYQKKFKPEFTNSLATRSDGAKGSVEKSIKSLRDYKLGVVFTDDYGRETPILISESGGFKVEKEQSKNANRLVVGLKGSAPENMAYFKFFIKETSTEYYNLAMDRWYQAEDGNIWLAFPSNDRNKVDLETSLYFKKGNEEAIENTTRYKILAIENEAPEFIKTRKLRIGTVTHNTTATPTAIYLFGASGAELEDAPSVNGISFTMNWAGLAGGSPVFATSSLSSLDTITEDLYVQFVLGNNYSAKYKISEITKDDPATQYYVTLDTNLKEDMDFIFDNAASPGAIQDQVKVLFSKAVVENKPIFDGRFFAKIENDGKIKTQITDDSIGVNYIETARKTIYVLDSDSLLMSRQSNATFSSGANYYNGIMERLTDHDYSNEVRSDFVGPNDTNPLGTNFNYFYARQSYFGYSQYDHDFQSSMGGYDNYLSNCIGGESIYPSFNNQAENNGCTSGVWFIDRSTEKYTSNSGGDGSVTSLFWPQNNETSHLSPDYGVPGNNNPAAAGWGPSLNTGPGTVHFSGIDSTKMSIGFGGIMNNLVLGPDNNTPAQYFNTIAEDFFSVGEKDVGAHGDAGTVNFVKQFTSGAKFKWEHDPTETIYTFYNQVSIQNRVRFGRHDMGYDSNSYPHGDLLLDDRSGSYHRRWDLWVEPSMDNTTGSGWDPTALPGTFMSNGLQLQDIQLVEHDVWNSTTSNNNSGATSHKVNYLIVDTIFSTCQNNSALPKYKLHEGMMLTRYNNLGATPDQPNLVVKKITYDPATTYYRLDLGGYTEPLHWNGYDISTDLVDGQNLEFRQVSMNGASNYTEHNTDYFYDYWLNIDRSEPAGAMAAVGYNMIMVEPVDEYSDGGNLPPDPFVWETEPKEDTDLDIYYEISENNPINLDTTTIISAIPIGSRVENTSGFGHAWDNVTVLNNISATGDTIDLDVPGLPAGIYIGSGPFVFGNLTLQPLTVGDILKITKPNGNAFDVRVAQLIPDLANPQISTKIVLDTTIYNSRYHLNWHNCFSFRNGVESNRIKDNFNLPFIINGVKASTTLDVEYKQERRKHGLIYSGIYNSTSGVNNLNQFIAAEKITKDINPIYGSIQKLKAGWGQSGDLITLCEDRVLKILANKDALFNADGNSNITATNRVLGSAMPYTGEYGISKNPESFASESYRAYFTDKVRGAVMRLSTDGLTPISNHGMEDWFRDNLKLNNKLIGSYDDRKDEYNISLQTTTETIGKSVTFKENVRGWVSFKSFVTNNGISCANQYYTFNSGNLWRHHDENKPRNTFYNVTTPSSFNVILNDSPGLVKSFHTVNYEGTQTRVTPFVSTTVDDYGNTIPITTDNEYYNLTAKQGWYVDAIFTNKEKGRIEEFIEKEGKWFFYLKGEDIDHMASDSSIVVNSDGSSLWDQASFAIQGIGALVSINVPDVLGCTDSTANNYDPLANVDDGSCTYDPVTYGCMDPTAINYNPSVNNEDGSCLWGGCTDPTAFNYDSTVFPDEAYNYTPSSGINGCPFTAPCVDDGSCIPVVEGCTDPTQFNYDPLANTDDGSCIPIILGCVGQLDAGSNLILAENAINYAGPNNTNGVSPPANTDDGSCQWSYCDDPLDVNGDDANAANNAAILLEIQYYTLNPGNGGSITPTACISGGCMDPGASNYDASALWDDGSCVPCIYGCMLGTTIVGSQIYSNYDPNATCPCDPMPTCCIDCIYGCTDSNAANYDATATCDDGSCVAAVLGCTDPTALNYDSSANVDDGTCYFVAGCTNPNACNYNSAADFNDGSCEFTSCLGCTDPTADNYDPTATVDDGSCIYLDYGCTDSTASNFDFPADATHIDDGSCITCGMNGGYTASNLVINPPTGFNTNDGSISVIITANFDMQANFAANGGGIQPGITVLSPADNPSVPFNQVTPTFFNSGQSVLIQLTNVGNYGSGSFVVNDTSFPGNCLIYEYDIAANYPNWPAEYSGVYSVDTPGNQGTNSCQLLSNMPSVAPYTTLCGCCYAENNLIFDASDALDGNTGTYTTSCAGWGCSAP